MFRNRSVQVKLVKDPKSESTPATTVCRHITKEMITSALKESVVITSVAVVGGLSTLKVVDAVCTIAVNYAPKN